MPGPAHLSPAATATTDDYDYNLSSAPLTASFPIVPARSLADLLMDPLLHLLSLLLLPATWRAIRRRHCSRQRGPQKQR